MHEERNIYEIEKLYVNTSDYCYLAQNETIYILIKSRQRQTCMGMGEEQKKTTQAYLLVVYCTLFFFLLKSFVIIKWQKNHDIRA